MVDTGSQSIINSLKSAPPKPSKIFVASLNLEGSGSAGSEGLGYTDISESRGEAGHLPGQW